MKEDLEQKIKLTYETNADEVSEKVESLTKEVEKTTEQQKKATEATKSQEDALGTLAPGLKGAADGVKSIGGAFKALLLNPVVLFFALIVGALAAVYKAFTSTKEGGEKMDRIFAAISATVDVFRDRILQLWDAITSFDFDAIVASFSGIADEIEREAKAAVGFTKALQEVEDASRDLGVSRAKLNRDLAESERILTSSTATYKEKQKALQEVGKAESAQTEMELANARKKLKAIEGLNDASDSSAEALQARADAQTKVYELEQKSSENRRKVQMFSKTLDNEESARLKTISEERKRIQKERLDQLKEISKARQLLLDEEFNREQALLRKIQDLNDKTEEEKISRQKERDLAEIEALRKKGINVENMLILNNELYATLEQELVEKRQEEKRQADEKTAEEAKRISDEILEKQRIADQYALEQKQLFESQKLEIADQSVGLFKSIFGKSKEIQKAALIAESAIGIGKTIQNVTTGNAAALAQGIVQAGPVAGPALAAPAITMNTAQGGVSVAANIAATAKALGALGGGSAPASSGNQTTAPGIGSGTAAPQTSFQTSSENQIASSVSNKDSESKAIQAYVVSSEMTAQQETDRNTLNSNSLG